MKEDNLIEKWLAEEASSAERKVLKKALDLTGRLHPPVLTSKEKAWDKLTATIDNEADDTRLVAVRKKTTFSRMAWVTGIAALLLIGYFVFFNGPDRVTHSAGRGELQSYTLPNNSVITLNAGSAIEFSKKDWEKRRDITLTGEAFFEVTEGAQFTVRTTSGTVRVLGTSFNVYDRGESFQVQCFSGKVHVNVDEQQAELTAGQRTATTHPGDRLEVRDFNPRFTATWRAGEFYFDAVELKEVMDELERQFDIQIELSAPVEGRIYSGFFSNQDLTEALQLVFTPMGFSFDVNGNTVTVQ